MLFMKDPEKVGQTSWLYKPWRGRGSNVCGFIKYCQI